MICKANKFLFVPIVLAALLISSSCADKGKLKAKVIYSVPRGKIMVDGGPDDWDAEGIKPLEDLEWKTRVLAKPAKIEDRRIKSVRLVHDEASIFLLLEIEPGIEEYFNKTRRSGQFGCIFLDTDGSDATGIRRSLDDAYAGWDYQVDLSCAFTTASEASGLIFVQPDVGYKIERMNKFVVQKLGSGLIYYCELEDVKGGEKISGGDSVFISFAGNYLEMRFSMDTLRMYLPTKIRLIVQDLTAANEAETQIYAVLRR